MEKVLRAAGLPARILSMIPQVVETCRECRAWQRPGPAITSAVDLVVKQNDTVQADILFYKIHLVWHMVDVADRWHAAVEITNKTIKEICDAIATSWVSIYGPFKHLVVDGERD